jgi:hypothetical protein
MARRSVQNEVKRALLGEEELFESQYLYLLPMLRCSKVLTPMHKSGLMRLGRDQSHHPAVRAEALISLILFPLKDKDFGRIKRQYQKETSPLVKKTILALFLKARDQIKKPMFAETILDPEEEINRYRKYIWALMNSPRHCQPILKILKTMEKDPSRLLASLHGALQSHNIETLKQVKAIARNRAKSLISEIARQAYKKVADDAGLMIEDKTRSKDKK